MRKFLFFLIFIFLLSGCTEQVVPTENGIKISIDPNPVSYSTEKDGWYFNISIENLGSSKIYLSQAVITGTVRFLIFSFDLPEQILDSEELQGLFGTNEIEPYKKITAEKGYTYQEIEEKIKPYEGYPGVSVNSFIAGTKLRIFIYGTVEDGTPVDASTGIITFSPKQ